MEVLPKNGDSGTGGGDTGYVPPTPMAICRERIGVKVRDHVVVLRIDEIDWVEAEHDYVSLHAGTKAWLARDTLARIEVRFGHAGFVRIHRSILVNAARVRELHPVRRGEFIVVLQNDTKLKLTRNYRSAVGQLVAAIV
jgi:two-component system, LytTR family, response regulator